MVKKDGFWKLSLPLRILLGLCALLYSGFFLVAWAMALMGDTSLVFDIVDIYEAHPLTPLQIVLGMICFAVVVVSVIMIFLAANDLLVRMRRDGFFAKGIARGVKRLGYGVILFWVGMILVEEFYGWILTWNLPEDDRIPFEWIPFDMTIIFLLIGVVLLLMSQALREAREIDQENKQII